MSLESLQEMLPGQPEALYSLPAEISRKLDEAVFSSQTLSQVLDLVLDTALELLGAQDGSLRLVDYQRKRLVLKARRLAAGQPEPIEYDAGLPLHRPSVMAWVVQHKQPRLINACHPDWEELYVDLDQSKLTNMRAELAVPLWSSDDKAVVGVLNVESPHPDRFTEQHKDWLDALARRARMVIQRAQLAEALQNLARKVLDMDRDALLEYTVKTLAELLQVPVCSIWLIDPKTEELVLEKAIGRPPENLGTPLDATELQQSFLGRALISREPCYEADVQNAPGFLYRQLGKEQGWVSSLAIPILDTYGKALGVTSVYSVGEERSFTDQDKELAVAFSNQVATVLQQAPMLQKQERNTKHLHVINEILKASVSESNIDALLHQAASQISQTFDYRVDICVLEQEQLVFKATVLYDGTLEHDTKIWLLNKGIVGVVASSARHVILPDVNKTDLPFECCSPETRSELAVPIINKQNRVIGVLNVESHELAAFSEDHLPIFQGIASGITLALENARRLQERTALRKISASVNGAQEVAQILKATLRTARELFAGNACSLYLVAPDGQHVTRERQLGLPSAVKKRAKTLAMGQSIAGKVALSGTSMAVWDAINDPRNDGMITADDHLRSLMAAPIKSKTKVLGVLIVLTATTRYFTEHEVEMLEDIADHVGLAIEQARAHDQYRRLFQDARDPMFTVNLQGYIVDANSQAVDVSGYEYSELLRMHLTELVAGSDMAKHVHERLQRISKGFLMPLLEFAMQHKDGSTLPFESNLTAICAHNGTITHIQAIWRDITERRRLAEAQTAATVLEQMGLVGSVLAHKVCGFLGAIGATADLLHSRIHSTDVVTSALLTNLRAHGRMADRLVAQLRGMRRAAHQQVEIVSLNELVEAALQDIDIPAHIRRDFGLLDLPAVRANSELLGEILHGLIRNALDTMPQTGTLSIRGDNTTQEPLEVWLYVSDTGPGMDPKVRENVFKPFFSTKTDTGGGLGLGLWLSRLYLRTLGGDIDVLETSAQGTTFVVRLPIAQEWRGLSRPALPSGVLSHSMSREATMVPQSALPRVLIVDDAPDWQGVLSPLFMSHGFRVESATDMATALRLLEQHDFAAFAVDVRLVDYDEENMDGLEIVQHIRARYASAPVLILSVWEPALQTARERFGACGHITILDKMDRDGLKSALDKLATQLCAVVGEHA